MNKDTRLILFLIIIIIVLAGVFIFKIINFNSKDIKIQIGNNESSGTQIVEPIQEESKEVFENLVNKNQTENNMLTELQIGESIQEETKEVLDDAVNKMQSQEIQIFNMQFKQYEGTQKGATIQSMITKIKASNSMNSQHQVTLKGADKIDLQKSYIVELSYDKDGYVNLIEIK